MSMEGGTTDGTPRGNAEETTVQQLQGNHWAWLLEDENMDLLLDVHRQLQELPETSQTWTYSALDGISYHDLTDELIVMVDSWEAPGWMQSSQKAVKYVNPNYPHRARLGEPATKCRCGAVIGKSNVHYGEDWNGKHNEGCRIEDKKFTDGKVWEKRRKAMRESLMHLRKEPYMADRLGITQSTMSHVAKQLGFARWEMRQDARAKAKVVAEQLVDDYMRKEVAVPFSVDRSTISKWVNGPY